ncbi:plasmid mobilization relaxosome protein MobC [Nocardia alni]|uniref:plasmid mobilization relaxosome protein MobC n=1 Tax=Nocardia alni TaxID=2815723 RepID=UPI001C22646B|nr:plasmid mobilization relaxosome protein MobC [Nocardia alni]
MASSEPGPRNSPLVDGVQPQTVDSLSDRGAGDASVIALPVSVRARARRRQRQANTPGGRAKSHCVKVTAEQELELVARAHRAKVSVSRLLVEAALSEAGREVGAARDIADRLMGIERLLANVANNVNQMAATANSGGGIDHRQLAANMALLRRMRERLDTVLDGWSAAA